MGIGIRIDAKAVLGANDGRTTGNAETANGGSGAAGSTGAGPHVEQHTDADGQSAAGG